jgi:glycosyltransferase domain-containing protein
MKLTVSNDLTIILLLKGRDDFTLRWFDYAKTLKLQHHVIIADGGADNRLEDQLKAKGYESYVSYEYIRYPYDDNYKLFYAKVLNALGKVQTPYVVLASNDDFYFFDSLDESVSFLKENPDFVTSRGEVWDFQVSSRIKSKNSSEKSEIYGNLGGVSKLYSYPTVIGESAIDRVADFSFKANSIWHDVVRTANLKEAYGVLVESEINDLVISDNLICFMLASQGKIHRSSNLYMLHQCHRDMAALTDLHDSPFEWIDAPGWDADFNRFLDLLAFQISKVDKTAFYEAKYKLLKIYTDSILLVKMKTHLSLLKKEIEKETSSIFLIKKILKRNKFLFQLLKFAQGFRPLIEAKSNVPLIFLPKIDLIRNFLKKNY